MASLRFYTKPDCPLCDHVREALEQSEAEWTEVNILEDPVLYARYRNEIPVIEGARGVWFYREREAMPLAHWLVRHS